MSSAPIAHPKGSALIVAMVLVILMASLSTVLVKEISERAKHVEIDLEDIKAFEAAEAGIDAALNDINSAPVYQPKMSMPILDENDELIVPDTGTRLGKGELNSDGSMPEVTGGYPLITPITRRPITVHVARKADGTKPGCLGTSGRDAAGISIDWRKPIYDYDSYGRKKNRLMTNNDLMPDDRPTWKAIPFTDATGNIMKFTSGPMAGQPRYCEDNIAPQSLGSVAFFTYTIDWFHDRVDNDGDGLIDDRNERNKYTVYSTGIHRGISQSGVTETGKVVTIEVMAQAQDKDLNAIPRGALEIQIKPRE